MGRPVTATAAANTEVVLTIPALGPRQRVRLRSWGGGFDGTPTSTELLTFESPSGTALQKYPITTGGPAPIEPGVIEGAVGEAVVIRLTADSGGKIGYCNAVIDTD